MSFPRSSRGLRQLQTLTRSFHSTPAPAFPPAVARKVPVPSASRSARPAAARSTLSSAPAPAPVASKVEDVAPPFDDFDFDSTSPAPAASRSAAPAAAPSYAPAPATKRADTSAYTDGSYASFSRSNSNTTPNPTGIPGEQSVTDWTTSFAGLSDQPFSREIAETLLKPINADDIEVKPDGLLYLPEIKYRRVLNLAFGPGGWGLAPRGETHIADRNVSREWGLVCLGRLVSVARGEQEFFDTSGIPTATEACKSNALMRCCKDLGIASELWDPVFIRQFKEKHCVEVFVEHTTTKKKKKLIRKKTAAKFTFPWAEK